MASTDGSRRLGLIVALTFGFVLLANSGGSAQDLPAATAENGSADVIALLDQEKPDPDKAAALAADADREVAPGLADADRGEAYFHRAQARALVGRINDAITDTREAVKQQGQSYVRVTGRYLQFLHRLLLRVGNFKEGVAVMMTGIRSVARTEPARLFALYDELAPNRRQPMTLTGSSGLPGTRARLDSITIMVGSCRSVSTGISSGRGQPRWHRPRAENQYADAEAAYGRARQRSPAGPTATMP